MTRGIEPGLSEVRFMIRLSVVMNEESLTSLRGRAEASRRAHADRGRDGRSAALRTNSSGASARGLRTLLPAGNSARYEPSWPVMPVMSAFLPHWHLLTRAGRSTMAGMRHPPFSLLNLRQGRKQIITHPVRPRRVSCL